MLPENIIRSLSYIEENVKLILLDAKGGVGAQAIHDDIDFDEFWKFYNELASYLESYSGQVKNEQISYYTKLYIQHRDTMDKYQKC